MFCIFNINEVIIQTEWNKLFSGENKVSRTLFEARKVVVKQFEIVLCFKVSLII